MAPLLPDSSPDDWAYGKSTNGFKRLVTSLEPSDLDLGTDQTPVDRFFVCSGSPAPRPDPDSWVLSIEGDAVGAPVELTLADLQSLPQHDLDSWLECAGNGRAMYDLAGGYVAAREAADTGWTLGGMGMASWGGPRLADVLELAGLDEKAAWIGPEGLDVNSREGEAARMSMPLDKAVDPDTLVALRMNDAPLTAAHGAPARLLVPGWVGAYSVKWLARLEVSASWISSWRSDTYYVHRLADGTKVGPVTVHPLKSCLTLPWGAAIASGRHTLRGYARFGAGVIDRVEYSIDDGPWALADVHRLSGKWAWTPFEIMWDAPAGNHQIRTRAWDDAGNTQPDHKDYHPNTILWDAITRHPVSVGA